MISCWRRDSGSDGDISAPNVEKAWCNASGISECEETMPEVPSPVGCTGVAYSTGYIACCASTALRSASFASLSGMVRIQVMVKAASATRSLQAAIINAMRLLSLCLIATLLPTGQHPADPLAARTKGSAKAPVVVYEMADFQCPACREFAVTTLPVLDKAYVQSGKVRWVFVNLPLTNIHKNAVAAAQVAMCAARQNKFWPVHDAL